MDDFWVITWGLKGKDGRLDVGGLKTEVVPSLPWKWLETKMDEKHERMKEHAVTMGKPVPNRPDDYVLFACWKLRDIG